MFNDFNYELNNTTLLINSYKSNSIQLDINIKYDSYLYSNITLENILFDIMIPDLQPPGIKINDIQPLQADDLLNNIIDSIEYIEYNNDYDISLIDISFNRLDLENPNDLKKSYIDISFILTDNANNKNILSHTYIISFVTVYKLYYYDRLQDFESLNSISPLTINFNELGISDSFTFNNKLQEFMNNNNEIPRTPPFIGIFKNPIISNLDSSGNYPNDFSFNNILQNDYSDDSNITIKMNYNTDILSNSEFNLPSTITIINNVSTAVDPEVPVEDINTHCCYKKVYYKGFVDNYKQGSSATSTMRMTKFIINRHR